MKNYLLVPASVLVVSLATQPAALARCATQEPATAPAASTSAPAEADDQVQRIEALATEIDQLEPRVGPAEGELQRILRRRLSTKRLALVAEVHSLAADLTRRAEQGEDTGAETGRVAAHLEGLTAMIRDHCLELESELAGIATDTASLSSGDRSVVEGRLAVGAARLTALYETLLAHADHLEQLDLDPTEAREFLTLRLEERAENLSARADLVLDEVKVAQGRLEQDPTSPELQVQVRAAEQRLKNTTAVLASTIELMERAGMDTASYRQMMVTATGQLTPDLLDAEVAAGLLEQWLEGLGSWAKENGPAWAWRAFLFVAVLLLARFAARLVARLLSRATEKSRLNLSQLLQRMIVNVATQAVWILGFLFALAQLGISLAPLLAGLGIAGFVVGFALQDTLANFAAGLMILIYRPYDVGDMIEAGGGVFGQVHRMNLVSTTILTIDNQTLVLPNGKIWGDVIKNVTAQTQRRVDLTFGISYSDDIPKAEKILGAILAEHPKVLEKPEPMVRLHNLGESSVDFVVRPWVETDDYWDVYWDVTREVKMRFDREGVSIPFPQRDVHLFTQEAPAA